MRDEPRPSLGIVRVGLVVREGAPKPDISTLDSFKKAMLGAKSVVHANPAATPSGAHLAKVWEQLGIADAVKAQVEFIATRSTAASRRSPRARPSSGSIR